MISSSALRDLREEFPSGTHVVLDFMNEEGMHKGLKGVVHSVDDIGTIHVNWENGSTLGVAYGEDSCHREGDKY